MGPIVTDIELWAGMDQDIVISVVDGAGALVDLTGATAAWTLMKSARGTRHLKKETGGKGIVIEDQVTNRGQLTVSLAVADTQALNEGSYYHACQITLSGKTRPVSIGLARMKRSGL